MRPQRAAMFALVIIGMLATVSWNGWWTLAPFPVAVLAFVWSDARIPVVSRPEIPFAIAWVTSQVCVATVAALSGGPRSWALVWLAVPMVTVSARLSTRALVAAVLVTEALILAMSFSVGASAVIADPRSVIYVGVAIAAVALLSAALMNSDLHHRSKSVIDPLTQMLNRAALGTRATELAEQSLVTGDPIALIVADLDNFKNVNDTHGHPTGDAVLRDVAYLIRKELRAFDLAYRLGGEEFLILLPGSDEAGAALIAERVRAAICGRPIAGIDVTISCGVAASAPDQGFDFDGVFAQADYALYTAKRSGRNRVSGTQDLRVPASSLTAPD